jgi:hypothetical protein
MLAVDGEVCALGYGGGHHFIPGEYKDARFGLSFAARVAYDFRVVFGGLEPDAAREGLGGAVAGELQPEIADAGSAGGALPHEVPVHGPVRAGAERRETGGAHVGVDQVRQQQFEGL